MLGVCPFVDEGNSFAIAFVDRAGPLENGCYAQTIEFGRAVMALVNLDAGNCMAMPFVRQRVELTVATILASAVDEFAALEFPRRHHGLLRLKVHKHSIRFRNKRSRRVRRSVMLARRSLATSKCPGRNGRRNHTFVAMTVVAFHSSRLHRRSVPVRSSGFPQCRSPDRLKSTFFADRWPD